MSLVRRAGRLRLLDTAFLVAQPFCGVLRGRGVRLEPLEQIADAHRSAPLDRRSPTPVVKQTARKSPARGGAFRRSERGRERYLCTVTVLLVPVREPGPSEPAGATTRSVDFPCGSLTEKRANELRFSTTRCSVAQCEPARRWRRTMLPANESRAVTLVVYRRPLMPKPTRGRTLTVTPAL